MLRAGVASCMNTVSRLRFQTNERVGGAVGDMGSALVRKFTVMAGILDKRQVSSWLRLSQPLVHDLPSFMIRLLGPLFSLALLCSLLGAKSPAPTARRELLPDEPTVQDLDRARELLERWESDVPEKKARVMRICYWSPLDREPQPDHRARLTRVMKHIQAFYLRLGIPRAQHPAGAGGGRAAAPAHGEGQAEVR
jgi:hypothetical protein